MLIVLDIGLGDLSVNGVGITDDVRVANGGVEFLERAGVAHPIGHDLAKPANALWTKVELARHISALSRVLRVKSATAAEISRAFGF